MRIVYVVQHVHILEKDDEDVKMIGVYSTEILAQEAVERLRSQPGFCDTPNGFSIDPYELDADHWTSGFVTLQ
jgi:hypothetical protein